MILCEATAPSQISMSGLGDVFELRVFLERHCARLAAHRATERQLQKMEGVLANLEWLRDGDLRSFLVIDREFHRLLYAASDNDYLADVLKRLYDLSSPPRCTGLGGVEDGRAWIEQHHKVLSALKAGDDAEAARLVEQHVVASRQRLLAVV
jgi:DNA-binding GntR family transcriptional regulator